MNVTREVVTDLLPIYFSGEASGDTKVLVEDYFRQDPDFERIARSAATPLETLRAAAPIAAGPEKEKRDLESIRWRLRQRKRLFAGSLFLTLFPPHVHRSFCSTFSEQAPTRSGVGARPLCPQRRASRRASATEWCLQR